MHPLLYMFDLLQYIIIIILLLFYKFISLLVSAVSRNEWAIFALGDLQCSLDPLFKLSPIPLSCCSSSTVLKWKPSSDWRIKWRPASNPHKCTGEHLTSDSVPAWPCVERVVKGSSPLLPFPQVREEGTANAIVVWFRSQQ